MGPPRKIGKIWAIFGFSRPTEKMGREGPKWGGDAFLWHKKISPTIWAERILILRTFDFWIFGVPNLPPIFSWVKNIFRNLPPFFSWVKNIFRNLPPIFSWVQKYFQEFAPIFFMGGPHVGPPTWAPRGPTGLGPGGAAGAGRILRSQPDPSPNAPRDEIRRKDPCCDIAERHPAW